MSESLTTSKSERLLRSLKPWQRNIVQPTLEGNVLWAPQSSPQWAATLSQADELFYGGQAGGGKSDLLIGLAITAHKKSIIFRREFAQLTALIERSREILGEAARYNGQEHAWRNIPGGRRLEFGGVQHEQDKNRYQGRPHDLKAFDEVTEFTESQYRFLTGWARSTDPEQRVRVVATGNPPTHSDGRWVIQYWGPWLDDQYPKPAQPGELRWFTTISGRDTEVDSGTPFMYEGELLTPKSRTFIPAALSDNPFLADSGYGAVLQGLPEPLRSQLLYGDFNVGVMDDPWQVIPTEWVRMAFERFEKSDGPKNPALTDLGVDVARGGDDETTICKRYGNWIPKVRSWPGRETDDGPKVAALVLDALDGKRASVRIDVIGIGAAAYDALTWVGVPVEGVNFAHGSNVTDRSGLITMRNRRAEAYWGAREALDPIIGDDLEIERDNELLADLTAARYKVGPSGIQIESKEDIKERIGRSPDRGDAFVLSLLKGAWALL